MPFPLGANVRVHNDCQGDQHLERRKLELEVRSHERAEAQAHGDSAEDEVEDVPAAVRLREMGREAVGPAISLL